METYPENTLLAMDKAIEAGAEQVEIDVGLSRDGHVIVLHDETVDRTTDGSGKAVEHTLAELQALDAGAWKNPAFRGQRMSTLHETLEHLKGRCVLAVELKCRGRDPGVVAEIARQLPGIIDEHGMLGEAMISAFELGVLLDVRRHEPRAKLMLIDWDPPESGGLDAAIAEGLHAWTPNPGRADPERVRRAVAAGLTVQVDIYHLGRVAPLRELGVRGFGSDNPAVLIRQLELLGLREPVATG